jgi:hypothetical protein
MEPNRVIIWYQEPRRFATRTIDVRGFSKRGGFMTHRRSEYLMGPYRVVEQIDDEVRADGTPAYRWRAAAFDKAGWMPCEVQCTAPTLDEAEEQLASAVNRMKHALGHEGAPLTSLLRSV